MNGRQCNFSKKIFNLLNIHRRGQKDLDNQEEVRQILSATKGDYKKYAELNWINYRNEFRDVF